MTFRNIFNSTFFLKALAVVLLLYIVYELSRTYPLYYPDPFFDYHTEYANYSLNSDRPVNDELLEVMDGVATRMNAVDIYDPEETYKVYLIHDSHLFGYFAQKLNLSTTIQALTINPLGYVLVNLTAIERTKTIYNENYPYTLYQGDIAHTISHELMHVFTTQQLGFFSSWFLPGWKREGYAEYGANLSFRLKDATYSLEDRVRQYLDGHYDNLSTNQQFYVRSGLIVEYLLDNEGMNFEELMRVEIDPDTVYKRLKEEYRP